MASIVNIIKISSSCDQWWKAEVMKKILWHVTPFMCLAGPTPELLLKHAAGSPAYFAVHQYHGIIPCEKNRLVLPMNGRRVKQQWSKYKSWACKACERHDMSQYLLHILSLSSLIKPGRYSYYILNWSHNQMLMLLKKKFWISSSFPRWYYPWIIY